MRNALILKVARWGVFSVMFALLPLLFHFLKQFITSGVLPQIGSVSLHGELLLVSSGIAATAVGEVIASGQKLAVLKILAGGGCALVLVVASFSYTFISAPDADSAAVSSLSTLMFIFAIVSSGACISLAEVK